MSSKRGFFTLLFIILFHISVFGQSGDVTDSTKFAFLPALAYNSDLGFIGGGIGSLYHYRNDRWPFYSFTNISAIFSTRGIASFDITYDKPQFLNSNVRLTTRAYISRFLENTYFGIANYQKVTDTPANLPNYYTFQSFSWGYNATFRLPTIKNNTNKRLDILAILNFDYETPWGNGSDRFISVEQPIGITGGRTFQLGTGFIGENRDSEFNPTKGIYSEASIEIGNKMWGSTFNNIIFKYDLRHYLSFHLLKDVVFANRFSATHTSGDVPYWKLSYAGDNETLRGYSAKRFLDDNAVIFNNELRTWLFDFPSIDTKLGGTLFVDIGRTFRNGTSIKSLTNKLNYSFGFGGTASFFTPDFIIRGDVGFSDEGMGIYISTGYMF